MKRKEVCDKTGLSQKALRLYEEKGLIQPNVSPKGHYQTRDYTQEDVERLFIITTLRRAMFTLSEIKDMLDDPSSIQTIYPQYLQGLQMQRQQLDRLIGVSTSLDISSVGSAKALSDELKSAADGLPIPPSDIHFNFRKLDELEEVRPSVSSMEETHYRPLYTAMGDDNSWVRWDQLRETKKSALPEDSAVPTPPEGIGVKARRGLGYLNANRKKCLGIGAGFLLFLALVIGSIPRFREALRPVEPMDGPSTQGIDLSLAASNISALMLENGTIVDMAIAPRKIYFIYNNALCSIDRDFSDFMELDQNCFNPTEDLGYLDQETRVLLYDQGYIYYIVEEKGTRRLMGLKTGTKVSPEQLWEGNVTSIALGENREIVCRFYAENQWTETARIPIP